MNHFIKNNFLIITLTIVSFSCLGQKKDYLFFDKFSVAGNNSLIKEDYSFGRLGFDLGFYHTWRNDSTFSFHFGFIFNNSHWFDNYDFLNPSAHKANITYSLNGISLPIATQINIGNKTRFFVELGIFGELNLNSYQDYTLHYREAFTFNEKQKQVKEKNLFYPLNYGVSLGLGIKVPMKKCEISINPFIKYRVLNIIRYQEKTNISCLGISLSTRIIKNSVEPKKTTPPT